MTTLLLLASHPASATPWCGTLARLGLHPARADRAAPPSRPQMAAPATCIDPQELADQQGFDGTFDQSRTSAHFLLAWDASNAAVTEQVMDTYEEALEASWDTEVTDLGWQTPDETDRCLITVVVAEFPSSWGDTGGYTDVIQSGTVPYMILNSDWLQYGEVWQQTLVAHEFNHASQFSYDVFWDESDWWYWEATAEWVPDEVYDDANTYVWSLWSYLYAPELGLESTEEYVDYGHFAFNTVLAEQLGPGAVLATWSAAGPDDGLAEALDAGLAADGLTFEDAVFAYTSHVAAVDVQERETWLEAIGYFEVDPYRGSVDTYPAEDSYDDGATPEALGQNFLHLGGAPGGDVAFAFAGEPEVGGVATEWAVTVARVAASGDVQHDVVRADEDGLADVVIVGLGEDVTDVYIGVVPMGAIGTTGAGWSWSAALASDPADSADTQGDGDAEAKACGCQASAASGGLLAGVLGAALVARRRAPRAATPGLAPGPAGVALRA